MQFCNFDEKSIKTIAEVNVEKFGSYTPGTLIPIVSEEEAKAMNPDYFLVLPWHFKDTILKREKNIFQMVIIKISLLCRTAKEYVEKLHLMFQADKLCTYLFTASRCIKLLDVIKQMDKIAGYNITVEVNSAFV